MTKKHFEAIAADIKALNYSHKGTDWDSGYNVALRSAAERLANTFQEANPRFDRETFLAACGY